MLTTAIAFQLADHRPVENDILLKLDKLRYLKYKLEIIRGDLVAILEDEMGYLVWPSLHLFPISLPCNTHRTTS